MNKNTRLIRKMVRKAGKAGNSSYTYEKPVFNYHSEPKAKFTTVTIPTAIRGEKGVISMSNSRNMQMAVYLNQGDGFRESITVHEPMNKREPVRYKNHSYISQKGGYYQVVK